MTIGLCVVAQPAQYNRQADFTTYQTNNPNTPMSAGDLDSEFNALKVTLDQTLANMALLQRDDGQQANASVGNDQLKTDLLIGISLVSDWLTATAYATNNLTWQSNILYRCAIAHTSGIFVTDLANKVWVVLIDFSIPVNITNNNALQTTADTLLTAADVISSATNAAAALASKNAIAADALQTAADRAATNADVLATAANKAATNANVLTTANNVSITTANKTATNADVAQTALDKTATNANAAQTALDKTATTANVVTTTAKAAAASTSEANAANSALSAGNFAAQAGAAAGIITDFPTVTGAPNYIATVGITGYTVGKTYRLRILQQNLSNTPTLSLDGLPVTNIKSISGKNIGISTMLVNAIGDFYYDGVNFLFLNPGAAIQPAALSAYVGAAFTVNTYKKVAFNATKVDTLKAFDNLNNQYVPTTSGFYYINASLRFLNCVVGDVVSIYIRVNAIVKVQLSIIAQQIDPTIDITHLAGFNGTTTKVDVYVYNITRATSTLSTNAAETYLEIFRVG